ncbi:MAG: NIPSNAP family protein [Acidimicrobiales bacterium]|nr:NIPSNAP family protein [Acidimicrobiales bacterium]
MTNAERQVFLHVTLKIRQGMMGRFDAVLAEMVPALEEAGWRLVGAWTTTVGRLNTVIDLWELPDADAVESVLAAVSGHPDFGRWYAELSAVTEDEVLALMTPTAYARRAGHGSVG